MPKARLVYEHASRTSQALIIGFSLVFVLMISWLVLLVMFAPNANTKPAEVAAPQPPPGPPRVENPPSDDQFPLARTVRVLSVTPPDDGLAGIKPSSSPPTASPVRMPVALPATAPTIAPAPRVTAPQPGSYVAAAIPQPETVAGPERGDGAAVEIDPSTIPLPHPRPRHVASIPVPRPRPRLDEDPPPQEKNLFELLFDR
jgi:hypothetical protein